MPLAVVYGLVFGSPTAVHREGCLRGDTQTRRLVPGSGMSIYGLHLGEPGRTQVLIGDTAAELLYVSGKQINFKVPADLQENVRANLRVVYEGQSSEPLAMDVGPDKIMIDLDQPAYADMPVWLRVDMPFEDGTVRYPFVLGRAGFGCNEVEVRKDGARLPLLPGSNWSRDRLMFAGNICGSYPISETGPSRRTGRLPLHLLYRFDSPGIYEVRFTLRSTPFATQAQTEFKVRSDWTPIEILPAVPNQRAAWISGLRRSTPSGAEAALTDVLPGLLGIPDRASLALLTTYLYHPDASVRRFAINGLYYWPNDLVSRTLIATIRAKGATDEITSFLARP